MTIRYRKIKRKLNPTDSNSEMRVFPVVTYKYARAVTLSEFAKKIAKQSILGEGEVYNNLKYFCSLLQEILLEGKQVNIDGLGYFFLALQGNGAESEEEFTTNDITGIRICFRAHNNIRIHNGATTRTEGLDFLDVDKIQQGNASDANTDETEPDETDPDGTGGNEQEEDPLA